MKTFLFDPHGDLIRVTAVVWGPSGHARVRMAVDTGSTLTSIVPPVLGHLGYGADDALERTVVRGVSGDEHGHLVETMRFTALGFSLPAFVVHALPLPSDHGIDGLIGLSFLRNFNYAIRSMAGQISVERFVAA